jgi:hypothetical protein
MDPGRWWVLEEVGHFLQRDRHGIKDTVIRDKARTRLYKEPQKEGHL